jgi:DNA-directed RNA polymerase specialized sigma24 family protein
MLARWTHDARGSEPRGAAGRPAAVTDMTPSPSRLARFETLFTEHQRAVLAYAMRRTPTLADAEDAVAETFAIAWRKIDAVPADEPLPWLYAVARRVLANHRRGLGRRERLAALLRNDDQEVLRLVAWEELGNQQIAAVLGVTANAVAIRLHRARARFAAALERASADDNLKHLDPSRTSGEVKGAEGAAWNEVTK